MSEMTDGRFPTTRFVRIARLPRLPGILRRRGSAKSPAAEFVRQGGQCGNRAVRPLGSSDFGSRSRVMPPGAATFICSLPDVEPAIRTVGRGAPWAMPRGRC